jgi:dTDP-4-amino-4,6-dideoxygalactose transaminase
MGVDRERHIMYARKRLDIGCMDLLAGLRACATAFDEEGPRMRIEHALSPPSPPKFSPPPRSHHGEASRETAGSRSQALACLSVRSGLDLFLQEVALPRGSEVLMSALTIPDMWKIVEHHGLVPVPVDLDARTLAPSPDRWRACASPRTRAVIVAHLFGARVPLEPIAKIARERGWLLLEDCAQSYTGDDDRGSPLAHVSMFSFGPIKTATALAGGVLVVRDRAILEGMRARQAAWPEQDRWKYFTRTLKYSGLVALTKRPCYAAFVKLCEMTGKDHDHVIQGSVRGFAGGEFFEKIRHRPNAALLAMLARRLENRNPWRVTGRVARAKRLARFLPGAARGISIPGALAPFHSHWVYTILADDPDRVVAELRASGFDATRVASLRAVPAPIGRADLEPREAHRILLRAVYLPCYPEMPERAVDAMAAALARAARGAPDAREGGAREGGARGARDTGMLTPAPASSGFFQRPRR